MVKVDRAGAAAASARSKKSASASSAQRSGFKSRVDGIDTASQARTADAVQSVGPVGAVDTLLGLQEAGGDPGGRARGLKRGRQMLDLLEEVRRGLLLGTIPVARLEALIKLARQQREGAIDPALSAILDDIELRAEVELAKLGY